MAAMLKRTIRGLDWVAITVGSFALIGGAALGILPLDMTEVLGFVTGAISVWLTVKQNIWNWPIGIVNNIFFVVLFLSSQLYADLSLQIVYIGLSGLGWYWWLHGGNQKGRLDVTHLKLPPLLILGLLGTLSTWELTLFLQSVNDTAPFLDALTTVLSLVAQYLLTRKLLENWYVWIATDIIYIGLYAYKNLYLTSVLYLIFMVMCVVGWWGWRKSIAVRKGQKRAESSGIAGWVAEPEGW